MTSDPSPVRRFTDEEAQAAIKVLSTLADNRYKEATEVLRSLLAERSDHARAVEEARASERARVLVAVEEAVYEEYNKAPGSHESYKAIIALFEPGGRFHVEKDGP